MNETEMKQRTKKFAVRILDLADALPSSRSGNVIAGQITRSGTSVAANYRALCRAKSHEDFVNKTKIVEEESDETSLWLKLIVERRLLSVRRVEQLLSEANELTAIFVASRKTAMSRQSRRNSIENRKPKIENP
jgi:four helix bundle protein